MRRISNFLSMIVLLGRFCLVMGGAAPQPPSLRECQHSVRRNPVIDTNSNRRMMEESWLDHDGFIIPRGGSSEDDAEDCSDSTSEVITMSPAAEAATTTATAATVVVGGNVDNEEEEDRSEKRKQQLKQEEHYEAILQEATLLRQQGKELHDRGDWWEAANVFAQAADLLQQDDASPESQSSQTNSYYNHKTDYFTCRLHEALCRLKLEEYDTCVDICTRILVDPEQSSGAIRSRAHHRRAKAYLHLGRDDEALQDARAAAFLGDRKAVALYGKLMRGNNNNNNSANGNINNSGLSIGDMASPPMLNDLLQGRNPFLSNSNDLSQRNSMLLESLLNKSSSMGMAAETPSLLGQGGAGGTLAKSLLSSLTKRLETDSDSICAYLHKTNPTQLQQLGSLAGVPLSDQQAQRLVKFCHSVTPKAIRRTVIFGKRGWYGLTVLRKSLKVFNKYKHLLILWALAAWIQAAIRRPIPISKKAAKVMAAAAAAAAKK